MDSDEGSLDLGQRPGCAPGPVDAVSLGTNQWHVRFVPKSANLAHLRQAMGTFLKDSAVSPTVTRHMVLAVDEAVSAMVEDALQVVTAPDPGGSALAPVDVVVDVDEVRVRVTIRDTRTSYEAARPEDIRELERQRRHELGVFLIRQLCDEVSYSFRRGLENQLELLRFRYEA